eukprot:scaffold210287_cov40-Prasinocladus_malaysianus.AAC.1
MDRERITWDASVFATARDKICGCTMIQNRYQTLTSQSKWLFAENQLQSAQATHNMHEAMQLTTQHGWIQMWTCHRCKQEVITQVTSIINCLDRMTC